MNEQTKVRIELADLIGRVEQLKEAGYRLVQISCTAGAEYELFYSFDKDYDLYNLRLLVEGSAEIPSITALYLSGFLYENEIHDLFGLKFTNIQIDYQGSLYKTAIPTPFKASQVRRESYE